MSEPARPLTEEDLHGFVDGQLDPERRAEVERLIAAQPDLAQRAAADRRHRAALRAALAPMLAEPVPASLDLGRLLQQRLRRPRPGLWRMAAAVLLGVCLGGAGGWLLSAGPPRGLDAVMAEAASSYTVYARDPSRPVEVSNRDSLTQWILSRMHRLVTPPDLSGSGYDFMGGRIVATGHGPAALFVFRNAAGMRLAVFVRPVAQDRTTPIRLMDAADLDGCVWMQDGVGYSVIAHESYDRLLELARSVRQQVTAPG